jgi:hypothetical protein
MLDVNTQKQEYPEAKLEQKDEEIKQLKIQMREDKNKQVEFQNLVLDLSKKVETLQRELMPDLWKKAEALKTSFGKISNISNERNLA